MEPFIFLIINLLIFLAIFLVSFLWPKRRMWWTARNLPGPFGYPLIGNVLAVQGDKHNLFKVLVNFSKSYGTLYRFWLGTKLFVVVNDPADIQEVVGNMKVVNRDAMVMKTVVPFLGNGLITSSDDTWRVHRKIMTPTFHFKILKTYVEVFGRKASELCEKIDKFAASRSAIDIHKYMSMCSLESICETAIGITMDAEKGGGNSFYEGMCQTSILGHERTTKPWLLIDWLWPYTTNGRATDKIHKQIFDFTDRIVEKRLNEHKNKKMLPVATKPEADEGRRKIRTLLELLIESAESEGSALSVQDLKDELTTIAASGFDTTAISLSNLYLLIGLNPLIQDKISQELDSIFQGDLRPATAKDIISMEYLECVIKETLRLLPVAPAILREISDDITLPSGHTLPAGSSTFTFSYMVHRDPRYFPEPERFLPDRWLPDLSGTTAKHPYAYLPFSAGPRNCIGQKYAMLQMKSIASSVLRRFTVSHHFKEEDLKLFNVGVVMEFCKGYKMTFTRK